MREVAETPAGAPIRKLLSIRALYYYAHILIGEQHPTTPPPPPPYSALLPNAAALRWLMLIR
eukprot:7177962-Pyramimonas_sp.AAC.2